VILVTHGAIAHFLTEDWDVEDPMLGTAYLNCSCTSHEVILTSLTHRRRTPRIRLHTRVYCEGCACDGDGGKPCEERAEAAARV
jgi:hypothetical protein